MKYRYLVDSHMHSSFSPDGETPVMMMCEAAAKQGLYAAVITDHCECNTYQKDGYDHLIRDSYCETRRAASAFRGRIQIYTGVEIGQPVQDQAAAQDILDACEFDFTLASVHNIKGMEDFYFLDYNTIDIKDLLFRYFDEILETIAWGRFDSLAHLTYPWRYIVGDHGIQIDNSVFADKIDLVLKELIKSGKSLEINTSGLRNKIGTIIPDYSILRRYQELGGHMVTVGSDAHRWADVCGGVEQGMELAARAGFRHIALYVKHEPKLLPIV